MGYYNRKQRGKPGIVVGSQKDGCGTLILLQVYKLKSSSRQKQLAKIWSKSYNETDAYQGNKIKEGYITSV